MTNNYPTLTQIQLDAIATIMDDDLRESLHGTPGLDIPGAFLTAYIERDPSFVDILAQYEVRS